MTKQYFFEDFTVGKVIRRDQMVMHMEGHGMFLRRHPGT